MGASTNTVEELEAAVSRLPDDQLARFRRWFEEYDAQVWGRQIERDTLTGRLDALAREAREQFLASDCKLL